MQQTTATVHKDSSGETVPPPNEMNNESAFDEQKLRIQCKLQCLTRNIMTIHRFAPSFHISNDISLSNIEGMCLGFIEDCYSDNKSRSKKDMEELYCKTIDDIVQESSGILQVVGEYLKSRANKWFMTAPPGQRYEVVPTSLNLPRIESVAEARRKMNLEGFLQKCTAGGYYKFRNDGKSKGMVYCSNNCKSARCTHESCRKCDFRFRVDEGKRQDDGSIDWRTRKGIENMHFDEREGKDDRNSDEFDTFAESDDVVETEAGENKNVEADVDDDNIGAMSSGESSNDSSPLEISDSTRVCDSVAASGGNVLLTGTKAALSEPRSKKRENVEREPSSQSRLNIREVSSRAASDGSALETSHHVTRSIDTGSASDGSLGTSATSDGNAPPTKAVVALVEPPPQKKPKTMQEQQQKQQQPSQVLVLTDEGEQEQVAPRHPGMKLKPPTTTSGVEVPPQQQQQQLSLSRPEWRKAINDDDKTIPKHPGMNIKQSPSMQNLLFDGWKEQSLFGAS